MGFFRGDLTAEFVEFRRSQSPVKVGFLGHLAAIRLPPGGILWKYEVLPFRREGGIGFEIPKRIRGE